MARDPRLGRPRYKVTAVNMRDEKSQHKNRAKARRVLLTRLYDHEMQQKVSQRA